nr:hypothetical protein [Candidatus Sigynarchaeota archaeon]
PDPLGGTVSAQPPVPSASSQPIRRPPSKGGGIREGLESRCGERRGTARRINGDASTKTVGKREKQQPPKD